MLLLPLPLLLLAASTTELETMMIVHVPLKHHNRTHQSEASIEWNRVPA